MPNPKLPLQLPALDASPGILRLDAVTPTVFFSSSGDGLQQAVDITVTSQAAWPAAELLFRAGDVESRAALGPFTQGQQVFRINLPDLRRPAQVAFSLSAGGALQDQKTVDWQPQPHWEIHLVHASHHDLGYTDLPSHVLRQQAAFLDDALDFCRQTDHWPEDSRFHYVIEQSWSLLHYLEQRNPHQVQAMLRRLRQGRIEVTALYANQTTELCGHEELVRLLYPSFRLKRQYGIPILTAELNDIPGMAWGLASVLAGAGIRYFAPGIPDYYAWGMKVHPNWDEQAVISRSMKGAFWWQGPDTGRVLLWYEGSGISTIDFWTLPQAERDLSAQLADLFQRGYPFSLARVKLHSAVRDNSPVTLRFSQIARQWNARWVYPRLVVSTNARFFQAFETAAGAHLRTLRGDLPNTDYTVGAASTPLETGANRLTHDTLLSAEKFAAWASLATGQSYPAAAIAEANQAMLLFDEHTWGMAHPVGPAQEACWSQKREFAWRAAALAQDLLVKSVNRLADQVRLEQEGLHALVFNPLGWARSGLVTLPALPPAPCSRPLYWRQPAPGDDRPAVLVNGTAIGRDVLSLPTGFFDQPFDLLDVSNGQSVPYQVVQLADPQAARPFAAGRYAMGHIDPVSLGALNYDRIQLYEVLFPAEAVPSLGYKVYRFVPASQTPAPATSLQVAGTSLENRFYQVLVDERTGAVTRIYDKELGQELVDASAPHGFNQLVVRNPRTGEIAAPEPAKVAVGEKGPLCASLVIKSRAHGCPQVTQEIILYDSVKRIDFNSRILRDSTPLLEIYFAFPFAIPQPRFRYEASGSIIRPIQDQLPGSNTDAYAVQHWVSVTNAEKAVAWCSLEAPVAALGGLWPGYLSQAHHGITPPGYGHEFLKSPLDYQHGHIYSYAALNNFRTNFQPVQAADVLYRYTITSHLPTQDHLVDQQFGWEASTPFEPVLIKGPHHGGLSSTASFCQVEPRGILLLALKQAEDGDGWILRLAETTGRATRVTVTLPLLDFKEAVLTNLVEEDQQPLACAPHQVTLDIPANALATLRVK